MQNFMEIKGEKCQVAADRCEMKTSQGCDVS